MRPGLFIPYPCLVMSDSELLNIQPAHLERGGRGLTHRECVSTHLPASTRGLGALKREVTQHTADRDNTSARVNTPPRVLSREP